MWIVDMNGLDTLQIVTAGACFVPALVWAIVAYELWAFRWTTQSTSRLYGLLPMLATSLAALYAAQFVQALLPPEICERRPPGLVALWIGSDLMVLSSVAMFRHAAALFPIKEQPPGRRWLIVNYGLAAALGVLAVFPSLLPGVTLEARIGIARTIFFGYVIGVLVLSLRQISRFARSGVWRPGGLGEARYADLFVLTIGLLAVTALFFLDLGDSHAPVRSKQSLIIDSAIGLVLAAPFAARALGAVVRRFLLIVATISIGLSTHAAIRLLGTGIDPALRSIVDVAALLVPLLAAVGTQPALRAAIDRVLFRRSRHLLSELHKSLVRLSPELGILECCRQALAEVTRLMSLRGAAIVLTDRAGIITHGALNTRPLEEARSELADDTALPSGPFSAKGFRELCGPLKDALIEADVVGVIPIVSPRRNWGQTFITTDGLGATFSDDDIQAMQTFGDQLALILDAAELLERTVSVERSLAHSEKLAAIGELAARIAHEIRNPVTAAKSLAQQLAGDPASPFPEEHLLILEELERVERQVAALLRFARRDEYHLEAVDLGRLVGATIDGASPKLTAAGIEVEADLATDVIARADREKLRQVLLNLIDNAADALQGQGAPKLAFAVSRWNGSGSVRVRDNGPGIGADVLGQIFEPFYSRKTHGTGLGLAIAKRTIENFGGRISAVAAPGTGMIFDIQLPLLQGVDATSEKEAG